jgi:hypothetical protein
MKLNYSEGIWFAVPLRSGGFGVGVAARTTRRGPVILAYFFGPKRDAVPALSEVVGLEPAAAVKVAMISDLNLINGEWPILGRSPTWEHDTWPTPQFVRWDGISHRAWVVYYDDNDPGRVTKEVPIAAGTSTLDEDCAFGAGAVEIELTELLSPEVASDAEGTTVLAPTPQNEKANLDSWSASIFAGDDAADWLGELAEPEQIREALAAVVEAPRDEYLEQDRCGAALAAAEIVAACCGRPAKNLPDNGVEWVSAHPGLGKKRLVALAEKAVRRVETSSEMQEQFDESELKDEWHGVIKDLLSRLASKQV